MAESEINFFELILLLVGIGAAFLGFQLINNVFKIDHQFNWLMVIAIFNWLMLLVLFISLSLAVDISKKHLEETKKMILILQKKGKKL